MPTTTITGSTTSAWRATLSPTSACTYEKWGQTNRFSTQGYLNYRKTFAQDHTIEGTVGFDYMKNTVNGLSLTVTGADSDKVPTLAAGTDATGWADTNTNEALSSYFGRLNYDYKKKYLFMFTFRADGSSKFAEGNRWGYFPGGVGRLGGLGGEILERAQFQQLQDTRLVRPDG